MRISGPLPYWCLEQTYGISASIPHFYLWVLSASLRVLLVRLREVTVACDLKYFPSFSPVESVLPGLSPSPMCGYTSNCSGQVKEVG